MNNFDIIEARINHHARSSGPNPELSGFAQQRRASIPKLPESAARSSSHNLNNERFASYSWEI